MKRRARGRRGGRSDASGPRSRESRASKADQAVEKLLLASRLLESGEDVPALEAAGEAVWLDPRRPDGYLLIGEIHLLHGRAADAHEAFVQAVKKPRGGDGDPSLENSLRAHVGLARCDLMTGAWEQAVGALRKVLRLDETDPFGVSQALAEVHLLLGRPDACLEALVSGEAALPDAHLVAAFAHLERRDAGPAVFRARCALLGNVYLLACLIGEEPPDHGIAHGTESAGPLFAQDVGDRLRPYLDSRPDRLGAFTDIAMAPTVMGEVESLIELARGLNREADPDARRRLQLRLADLRNVDRIHAGTSTVLGELERFEVDD